jgi:hypothetical protein
MSALAAVYFGQTYSQESIGSKPFGWCSDSTEPENGECPEAPRSFLLACIKRNGCADVPVLLRRW